MTRLNPTDLPMHMQLRMVLEVYLPFNDEGSPLDGLTGLAFSTPG